MGVAIAAEAARRGADVTLVLGPSSLDLPPVKDIVRVRSAADMHAAVMARAKDADVVIMAAAVADYTPAQGAEPQKIAKTGEGLTLTLTKTRDILADLGRERADGGLRGGGGGRRRSAAGRIRRGNARRDRARAREAGAEEDRSDCRQ